MGAHLELVETQLELHHQIFDADKAEVGCGVTSLDRLRDCFGPVMRLRRQWLK